MKRISVIAATVLITGGALIACSSEGHADAGAPAGAVLQEAAQASPPAQPAPAVSVPGSQSLAPLIKSLKPAVVNIATTSTSKHPRVRGQMPPGMPEGPWGEFFERYFGSPREMPEEFRSNSLGSGFIINKDGLVLTNFHVVKDATEVRVRLADGREFDAKVIGRDPPLDVALLKLTNAKDLPTVALGDSDALEQGDFVLAMGNPFGLRESASFGIVSAKDRAIGAGSYDDFIQTDAAINPGNSGGPLFNLKGEVVGINTAIVSPQIGQGIGFAVPANLVKQVLGQLQSKGKVARGYLGVSVSDLSNDLAQGFGLPPGTKGAVVQQVVPKSPAAKAGVQAGDVVVALNGKPVEGSGQLTRGVATVPPGGTANLSLLRGGHKKEVSVTVAQRPDDEEALARGEFQEGDQGAGGESASKSPRLGIKLQALTPDLARQLKLEGDVSGVVVSEVVGGSAAERAGLQRGDVILEVNRQPVSKPEQVVQFAGKAKAGEVVLLRVRRGNNAVFVPLRVPEKSEEPAK